MFFFITVLHMCRPHSPVALESSKANRAHKKANTEQQRCAKEAQEWRLIAAERSEKLEKTEDLYHEMFGYLLEAEHALEEEKQKNKQPEDLRDLRLS